VIGVDQYQHIRHLFAVEGLSQREIARRLGISRNTVARYCQGGHVPWERQSSVRSSPVVTQTVREFIQSCLEHDQKAPRKQRHTARRIYERLRDELSFTGGESTIRRVVAEMKAKLPEVYVPLRFAPAEAAQVDWGKATVFIAGEQTEVNLFCMRLCHSCAPFVMAFPSQREEAFLEGHQRAFEYFQGVSKQVIYDNLKTAVKEGWGKQAKEQDRFKAFRAHYAYEATFCNPGEGHEKGLIENLVGYIRRNVLVPIPEVQTWEELNRLLLKRCEDYLENHHIRGRELSVKESYAIEQAALTPLPLQPFEAVKMTDLKVDYFATVPFEGCHYSVPVSYAGNTVTLKASAFWVRIYYRGQEIAQHSRSYRKGKTRYTLAHYLPLLEQRPRAVRHARPVQEANLPEDIWRFYHNLKGHDADRSLVRLLRLIVDYGLEPVQNALYKAMNHAQYAVEVVEYYLTQKVQPKQLKAIGPQVKPIDLACYDRLLKGDQVS
jgi:transposase